MAKPSLLLGVLLAIAPALGTAQVDRFRAVDRNSDRSLSSEEWYRQALPPVPFTVVDLDGDGRLSEREFRDWSSARGGTAVMGITPADRFRGIDRNRDNVLSPEEWKNGSLSLTPFESVDANKDGRISGREFSAWDNQRGGTAAAAPAPPGVTALPASGAAGASGPAGIAGPPGVQPTTPPTPSSLAPAPPSPVTSATSTGQAPGISSPSLGTATGNTTR